VRRLCVVRDAQHLPQLDVGARDAAEVGRVGGVAVRLAMIAMASMPIIPLSAKLVWLPAKLSVEIWFAGISDSAVSYCAHCFRIA
jgi:hypothetical protein